jgi:glutathione S-transferase
MKRMPEDRRQQRFENIGDPKRYDRGKTTFDSGVASPFVKYAVYAFEATFKNIEIELSDGKDWLVQGKYSLADLGLTPYLARLEYLNLLEVWLNNKTYTKNWWERIKTRPSFKKAVSDPLTKDEIEEMTASGIKIRDQIALIRDEL